MHLDHLDHLDRARGSVVLGTAPDAADLGLLLCDLTGHPDVAAVHARRGGALLEVHLRDATAEDWVRYRLAVPRPPLEP